MTVLLYEWRGIRIFLCWKQRFFCCFISSRLAIYTPKSNFVSVENRWFVAGYVCLEIQKLQECVSRLKTKNQCRHFVMVMAGKNEFQFACSQTINELNLDPVHYVPTTSLTIIPVLKQILKSSCYPWSFRFFCSDSLTKWKLKLGHLDEYFCASVKCFCLFGRKSMAFVKGSLALGGYLQNELFVRAS